jgi:hypothetical protein
LAVFAIGTAILTAVVSGPAGAEDKPISKGELKQLIANAKTPAAHERIAHYFDAEATKYEADAKEHEEEAGDYAAHPSNPANGKDTVYSTDMQGHCSNLGAKLKEAAQEARMLAASHRKMAKEPVK